MARILTRPMFKKGGLSRETGIMSGLDSPRRNYAGGENIGGGIVRGISMGSRTGFFDPNLSQPSAVRQYLQGIFDMSKNKSGQKIVEEAAKKVNRMERAGQATRNGLQYLKNKLPVGMLANLFRGAGQPLAGTVGPTASAGIGTQVAAAAAPVAAVGGLSAMNWPVYPKGHPNEGEFVSQKEAAEIFEKAGDAGTAGDIAGEAAMFDDSLPEETGGKMDAYGNLVYPTKFNWEKPEVVEVAKDELGLLPKDKDTPDLPGIDNNNNLLKEDEESALMSAYKEYLPVMEEALAGRPSTKSQWLALAKFGTGLMAQPGGDLIGAIGKASQIPLDDLAKLQEKMEDRKTQAKLLAIQSAMKDVEPGALGKAVKDIKKLLNLKGKAGDKAAFVVYEELQKNNTTQIAADTKAYRQQAKDIGVNEEGYAASMTKIKSKYPELVGQFNEILPDDPDERKPGYYIAPTGEFVRVIEKDGKIITIGMDEPCFKDKPKKK